MGDDDLQKTILNELNEAWINAMDTGVIQSIASIGSPPPGMGNITISSNNTVPYTLSVTLDNRIREQLLKNDNMLKIEHREDGTPMDDVAKAAIRGRILHAIADKAGDKVTYTKRKDLATNQTIVTGKVWIFNEEELSKFMDEVLLNAR